MSVNKKTSKLPAYKMANVSELIPYVNNARTHNETQIKKIAASIKEFGFLNPVITDGEGGIIAGHGRVLALQKLGIKEVPILEAAHLTKAQKQAYVIADNRLALDASWDEKMLRVEFGDLESEGFDLSLTGFTLDEIDSLSFDGEKLDVLEDDFEAGSTGSTVTVLGDVWVMGRHRIMCGDSTDVNAVEKLNTKPWDVCVFDPPYELTDLYYSAMPAHKPESKLLVMWDFKRFAVAGHAAIESGWEPQYELIWDCVQSWYTPNRPLQRHKAVGVFGDDPFFDTEKSVIVDGKDRGKKRTVSNTRGLSEYTPLDGAKHISTVEAFPNTQQTDDHGHGKPLKWIGAIFQGVGGSIYYDAFGGSGATLVACEQIGYTCNTMELDPGYCDSIVRRWQALTGIDAVNESSGISFDSACLSRDDGLNAKANEVT